MQYEITDSGTAELEAWLAVLPETVSSQGTDDLALRAHFVAQIEPAAGRLLLERWRDELWFRTQILERERDAALLRRGASTAPFPSRASLLGRRLRHLAAELEFLDELRRNHEGWVREKPPVTAASKAVDADGARPLSGRVPMKRSAGRRG
jgi:hypothetical protein